MEALTPDAITLRVLVKTAPMEQWAIARELRQRIKARFDHEGIEIAVPAAGDVAPRGPAHDGLEDEPGATARSGRRRLAEGQASAASSVIDGTAARAWLTGQLTLAPSAAATKSSLLMPSTTPRTVSRISVIPVPGTKSTSADVSSAVGGVPALASAVRQGHGEA